MPLRPPPDAARRQTVAAQDLGVPICIAPGTVIPPATIALLQAANLVVHPRVLQVTLHGSRGLAGGYRPDSDVDLSLLVDSGDLPVGPALAQLLEEVLATTLRTWRAPVEADLAAVFDRRGCGLACFSRTAFAPELCLEAGNGCFGLYKVQKGFRGFVGPVGVAVQRMYPCVTLWKAGDLCASAGDIK